MFQNRFPEYDKEYEMKKNALSLHSSAVGRANLKTYIKAAEIAGFDCIEPTKVQLGFFLDAGYTCSDIKKLLGSIEISSVGWLSDLDRQGSDFIDMMREAEKLFDLAHRAGSKAVEIINGPVDWHAVEAFSNDRNYNGYKGLLGMPEQKVHDLTVKNLQALADLAAQFDLILFFEPLCWTPVPSLKQAIPLVDRAERENLKIVVDFYHNYMAGLDPDFISKIDKDIILGVHICNARERDERIPCEEIFRDTGFYDGAVPIKDWVQAVKETGFDGWWAYETFSRREAENEVFEFTGYVHDELIKLIY